MAPERLLGGSFFSWIICPLYFYNMFRFVYIYMGKYKKQDELNLDLSQFNRRNIFYGCESK